MTRVISGIWRGRSIAVPRHGVRPTSDRVREAVFSALDHQLGTWTGLRVLDLFAGSGALGLEAVSRGAARAVLVERDRGAAARIRRTVEHWEAEDQVTVIAADAATVPQGVGEFDVLFADPPYGLAREEVETVLRRWCHQLTPGALAVVETGARGRDLEWPIGITAVQDRRYGDTHIWYGRTASEPIDKD
jgi:16S rRNA (guanine966-N2)-methyltransferase